MNKIFRLAIGSICVLVFYVVFVGNADAIPVFARKYQTSCTTCHVMPPKLNAFGDAFRMNGYQIPGGDEAFVKDEPVELGAKPWKEMWPDTVWPSTIPGSPIAVRVITDFKVTQDETTKVKSNFEFIHPYIQRPAASYCPVWPSVFRLVGRWGNFGSLLWDGRLVQILHVLLRRLHKLS